MSDEIVRLRDVRVVRDGRPILADIDWSVTRSQRWAVLGPNGSGKTTMCRVASLDLHPSSGTVDVLGERLGRTDVRALRHRIGLTSSALAVQIKPRLAARDVVMTAKFGALDPWWHRYDDADLAVGRSPSSTASDAPTWLTVRSAPCRRASGSGCCWLAHSCRTRTS